MDGNSAAGGANGAAVEPVSACPQTIRRPTVARPLHGGRLSYGKPIVLRHKKRALTAEAARARFIMKAIPYQSKCAGTANRNLRGSRELRVAVLSRRTDLGL
ncbi:hypothetical protein SDC9_82979 [bioreactor metagenome]|uniref:Uncharacterized protein n=1 Tax=bioreactor metagenome TaxID=1076179 RepID=A0A644ZCD8_9ZZZZ